MSKTFDCIVGNPPYGDNSNQSSFTNLWANFIIKSFELLKDTGYMAMVSPKTWTNQTTKKNNSSKVLDIIKKHAKFVNIDECGKYFNKIGSSFSYYIIDKSSYDKECTVITTDGQTKVLWKSIPFIPNNFNDTSIKIIQKILQKPLFDYISSSGTVGNISKTKTAKHIYSVRYSMGTEKWSDRQHKYQFVEKLIFPNQTTKNYPIYAPNSAPANRGVFYKVANKEESDRMLGYIKSRPIQFLISQQRNHHGVLNTEVIKRIPKVDLSKSWTDQELYEYFNLTPDEIKYIEETIK